ncbi:MAG: radical SAM protein [Candidatus Heimdallarchaeota archaeon]|nr:radical SAM protein [Candidatus Heimdallarchaeota archaeon]
MSVNAKQILTAPFSSLDETFQKAREMSWKYHGKKIVGYYPGESFPSVSITGKKCSQNCQYCDGYYLQHMYPATTPTVLEQFALKLARKGGQGLLISGGYTQEGIVPLEPFLPTIGTIKEKTDLTINAHVGLVNKDQAKKIAETGIDFVSYDLITDEQVISEILQSDKTGEDYLASYQALVDAKIDVIPHICLGLYYGTIKGNIEAIKAAIDYSPRLIVFLGLIPTKHSPMANSPTISPELVAKILLWTRFVSPEIEQSLGCMRVRTKQIEELAIKAGINRIAVPKKSTLSFALKTYQLSFQQMHACCASPIK